jgi:hypothetical protein
VTSKDGYDTYTSPTISVENEIVKHDIAMKKTVVISVVPKIENPTYDFGISLKSDTTKVAEGNSINFTIDYENKLNYSLDDMYVKVTIPDGLTVVEASNKGVYNAGELKWSLGTLSAGQKGTLQFSAKVDTMAVSELEKTIAASIYTEKTVAVINKEDDSSKLPILTYTNKFERNHKRYIKGYPDGTVKPKNQITRAEVAAIFARLLGLQNDVTNSKIYSDVPTNFWASGYIEAVTKKGLFKGYSGNNFMPNKPITRAELAAVIARYFEIAENNKIEPTQLNFTDVKNHWAELAIQEMYRFGIIKGYSDSTFKPNQPIIRSEAITMINRMFHRGPLTNVQQTFPDMPKDDWAFGEIEEATVTHNSITNEDGSEKMTKYVEEPLW